MPIIKTLKNGVWTPVNSVTSLGTATTTTAGLMSASDKEKLDNVTEYSTTETVVGTWVDGKPLYRKVVVYTGELANDTDTVVYNATSLSIDTIVKLDTMVCFANQSIGQPRTPNGRFTSITYSAGDKNIHYRQALTSHPSANDKLYITLEYTKTTD